MACGTPTSQSLCSTCRLPNRKYTEYGGVQSWNSGFYSKVVHLLHLISGVERNFVSEFCLRKAIMGSYKINNQYCSESENRKEGEIEREYIYICSIPC